MYVIKASGIKADFDQNKVYNTCIRAGADKTLASEITNKIRKQAYSGITTQEILKLILTLLKPLNPGVAIRYSLKRSMFMLGPSGFVFEKYIVRLLRAYNYKAYCPDIIRGACVNHEIDVIAKPLLPKDLPWPEPRQKNVYMIECKYHNAAGIRSGLKEVLYTWARFLDIKEGYKRGSCQKFDIPWLISNTKFSQSALEYAECKKIRLLGWRYPKKFGLQYLVENKKIYPITILRNLDNKSREKLFSQDIILCQDLVNTNKRILQKNTNIKEKKLVSLINEASLII